MASFSNGITPRRGLRLLQIRSPSLAGAIEALAIPAGAVVIAMILFGIFIATIGSNPLEVYQSIYKGAFGSWFSWQNTLQRASPLMLVALCTALPARLGMIVIGGEGALVIGATATVAVGVALAGAPPIVVTTGMLLIGAVAGGLWIGGVGLLRHYRGINETISSLLLNYIAIALMSFLVTGVMRDTKVLHRPSSWHVGEENMIGLIPGMDVHWGLVFGVIACALTYVLMRHTVTGFAVDIIGGNLRAARMAGLSVGKLMVLICFIGGAAAGLAGALEVVAVHGRASSSLVVGYGYTGILIAFVARQNPAAVIPVAILLGGISASGGLLQRWHDLPDATVLVLQGAIFVVILASEPLYGRLRALLLRGK
jgi:general nucleoside transport system permease protein